MRDFRDISSIREKLLARYQSGASLADLALTFDMTQDQVSQVLGLVPPGGVQSSGREKSPPWPRLTRLPAKGPGTWPQLTAESVPRLI